MPAVPERERLSSYYRGAFESLKSRYPKFDSLSAELWINLIRSMEQFRSFADRYCRRRGLTGPAFGMLSLLDARPDGRLSMREISERLLVTQANVTGLVDTLERQARVRRIRDRADRRVTRIGITPSGRRKLDAVRPGHFRFVSGLLAEFSSAEKRRLIRLLERLRASLGRCALGGLLLFAAAPPSRAADAARALGLEEARALALKRSEELAMSAAGTAEARARAEELAAAVRPRIALKASEIYQDDAGGAGGGVGGSFTQRSRPEAKLAARQPLFSGFREFLAYRAAGARSESAESLEKRAEDLLRLDATRAFVGLWRARRELAVRRELIRITRERIDELEARRRLGRSRRSEVLAAQAQLARLEARVEGARGEEFALQEALRFLTGLEGELAPELPADPPRDAGPEARLLESSRRRPDVEAARRELGAAELGAEIARRERWPLIGLDGNYYLKRPSGFTERIRWDVALAAELPLYTGGALRARTAQGSARRRAAEESLKLALRRAELETRSARRDLESLLTTLRSLDKAAGLAQANAEAQAEDYRLGMATNLEVLDGLDSLQEIRLELDSAKARAVLALARLEAAAGLRSSP